MFALLKLKFSQGSTPKDTTAKSTLPRPRNMTERAFKLFAGEKLLNILRAPDITFQPLSKTEAEVLIFGFWCTWDFHFYHSAILYGRKRKDPTDLTTLTEDDRLWLREGPENYYTRTLYNVSHEDDTAVLRRPPSVKSVPETPPQMLKLMVHWNEAFRRGHENEKARRKNPQIARVGVVGDECDFERNEKWQRLKRANPWGCFDQ